MQVSDCVNVLCRYIDNIIANPTETKFHKIRCENATFKEKVTPILGATELLYAAGFRQQKLDHNGTEEDFLVWDEENVDGIQTLEVCYIKYCYIKDSYLFKERNDEIAILLFPHQLSFVIT